MADASEAGGPPSRGAHADPKATRDFVSGRILAAWRRGRIARRLHQLDELAVGIRDEAGGGLELGEAQERVLEHPTPLAVRSAASIASRSATRNERWVRPCSFMTRSRGGGAGGLAKWEQLDPHPCPGSGRAPAASCRAAGATCRSLSPDLQLVLDGEPEQIAVEAQRALDVGDADADVGEALDREGSSRGVGRHRHLDRAGSLVGGRGRRRRSRRAGSGAYDRLADLSPLARQDVRDNVEVGARAGAAVDDRAHEVEFLGDHEESTGT